MTTVLLDTHALHWWSAQSDRLSRPAFAAISAADEIAIAAITWYELAWLARHERITVATPVRAWLDGLAGGLRTIEASPAIADTATALPASFAGDPADRLIYATAIEHGLQLVTKDRRLRGHRHPKPITIW